jgi:hypothetical protein
MHRLAIHPNDVFADSWNGWAEFLGNGKSKPRSPEQWVPVAESLANKHDGVLPGSRWRQKNGYSGLDDAMRANPEIFSHIKQHRDRRKSISFWVRVAEKVAFDNGGVLPCGAWLAKNGYSTMYGCLTKHPSSFSHIKREKQFKSMPEWVSVAVRLSQEHGGVLPCVGWLASNGYGGLQSAMRNHPEAFEHIVQDKPYSERKSKFDNLSVAKKLAKDNGGVLPNVGWLRRNGYMDVYQSIRKYPDLFSGIKRMRPYAKS